MSLLVEGRWFVLQIPLPHVKENRCQPGVQVPQVLHFFIGQLESRWPECLFEFVESNHLN